MKIGSILENKNLEKRIAITPEIVKKYHLQPQLKMYKPFAGNYSESVIPDPIPNSEVKPFCADGTLS